MPLPGEYLLCNTEEDEEWRGAGARLQPTELDYLGPLCLGGADFMPGGFESASMVQAVTPGFRSHVRVLHQWTPWARHTLSLL